MKKMRYLFFYGQKTIEIEVSKGMLAEDIRMMKPDRIQRIA